MEAKALIPHSWCVCIKVSGPFQMAAPPSPRRLTKPLNVLCVPRSNRDPRASLVARSGADVLALARRPLPILLMLNAFGRTQVWRQGCSKLINLPDLPFFMAAVEKRMMCARRLRLTNHLHVMELSRKSLMTSAQRVCDCVLFHVVV